MPICKCRFCDFQWESRVKKPVACARCKRYDYDKPRIKRKRLPGEFDRHPTDEQMEYFKRGGR